MKTYEKIYKKGLLIEFLFILVGMLIIIAGFIYLLSFNSVSISKETSSKTEIQNDKTLVEEIDSKKTNIKNP